MNFAVSIAALGLLGLAALLPFGSMGAFAAVPTTAAIGGAVALLWRAQPREPRSGARGLRIVRSEMGED